MDVTMARPLYDSTAGPDLAGAPWRFTVEPVIQKMQTRLEQPLSLHELADYAGWSPYHFHRLFRTATGIPPNEFLTTLRLQKAKRLLLTTSSSVTDICFDVGYASLGTFTARFTHLVGIAPGRLRHFTSTVSLPSVDRLGELLRASGDAPVMAGSIRGQIGATTAVPGPIFVGLFPKPIPQARPVRATVILSPGSYHIAGLPDGCYYLLAASLPWAEDPRVPTLADSGLLVGAGAEPLLVRHGHSGNQTDLALHAPRPTDPPVLSCLPFLLSEQLSRTAIAS
jgi:AraC-like DNA-binding protein